MLMPPFNTTNIGKITDDCFVSNLQNSNKYTGKCILLKKFDTTLKFCFAKPTQGLKVYSGQRAENFMNVHRK